MTRESSDEDDGAPRVVYRVQADLAAPAEPAPERTQRRELRVCDYDEEEPELAAAQAVPAAAASRRPPAGTGAAAIQAHLQLPTARPQAKRKADKRPKMSNVAATLRRGALPSSLPPRASPHPVAASARATPEPNLTPSPLLRPPPSPPLQSDVAASPQRAAGGLTTSGRHDAPLPQPVNLLSHFGLSTPSRGAARGVQTPVPRALPPRHGTTTPQHAPCAPLNALQSPQRTEGAARTPARGGASLLARLGMPPRTPLSAPRGMRALPQLDAATQQQLLSSIPRDLLSPGSASPHKRQRVPTDPLTRRLAQLKVRRFAESCGLWRPLCVHTQPELTLEVSLRSLRQAKVERLQQTALRHSAREADLDGATLRCTIAAAPLLDGHLAKLWCRVTSGRELIPPRPPLLSAAALDAAQPPLPGGPSGLVEHAFVYVERTAAEGSQVALELGTRLVVLDSWDAAWLPECSSPVILAHVVLRG